MPKTRLVCAAAVLLIGACASPAQNSTNGQVATLASAGPSTAATQAAAGGKRPQLRLDTSAEESDRLFTAYDDCLVAHGVKVNPTDQAGAAGDGPGRRLDQSGEPKSAYVACADR